MFIIYGTARTGDLSVLGPIAYCLKLEKERKVGASFIYGQYYMSPGIYPFHCHYYEQGFQASLST